MPPPSSQSNPTQSKAPKSRRAVLGEKGNPTINNSLDVVSAFIFRSPGLPLVHPFWVRPRCLLLAGRCTCPAKQDSISELQALKTFLAIPDSEGLCPMTVAATVAC
jgi:hypothetical protein